MNGGAPMHFHVKRHHKVLKLRVRFQQTVPHLTRQNKLADIYGIDVNAFRWGPFDSCANASLCWEAEVLRNEQLTFATIPNIEEDDLQEGLKLEMRAERELR